MGTVRVLDCTLRDGGYCNEWKFGERNIKRIVSGLSEANVDIIECGFLTNRVEYSRDVTKFTSLGMLFSIGIEAAQFYYGLGRCEVDDVIMNTLGCAIGMVPVILAKKISTQ